MNECQRQDRDRPGIGGTARAFVHICARDIGYWRSGRGRPVLLLTDRTVLRERLHAELAQGFTVISPELPARYDGIGGMLWLREFIDSLGLVRPHLVAAGLHGPAALHFALGDSERVDRIAILWSGYGAEGEDDAERTLEDRLHWSEHPLLLLRLRPRRARNADVDERAAVASVPSAEGGAGCAKLEDLVRFLGAASGALASELPVSSAPAPRGD